MQKLKNIIKINNKIESLNIYLQFSTLSKLKTLLKANLQIVCSTSLAIISKSSTKSK